jgi:serine/threonine protein kinase
MALAAGARLGPYDILSALGAGGMGEVYRALDTTLNREVALKVLPDAFILDPDRLARFKREAQVLASLNHPNIAAIYGFQASDRVLALVLELVDGPTLADRIAQGPMALDEALPVARQIAEAVEVAHEQGIIHRDLKPANIKLRHDGAVKVLDFGLAKALEPVSATGADVTASPTITTPAMTQMGVILDTAAYMSPEQAKGRATDKRSDVWAFGCVLYEMLTGARAFEGEDVSDTLAAVLRGEPAWTRLPDDVPAAIRTLLQRCLAKDRRQRVADLSVARYVLADAASLAVPQATPTPVVLAPAVSRWKSALPVAAVLLTAALVGVGTWSMKPSRAVPSVARFSLTFPEGQQPTGVSRQLFAISPDGTQLVYLANSRLFLRSLSEFDSHAISGSEMVLTGAIANPAFSPDGRSVAFFDDGAIKRIAVSGGAAVTICPADPPYGLTWDATGIVFGQGSKGIVRCSPNGGTPEHLATVKDDEQAHGAQLLPGGNALLFTIAKLGDGAGRWDKAQVVVQTMPSGARKTLISGGTDARYVRTGHLLYALGGVVFAVAFDPVRQTVLGGPVPVVEGVGRPSTGNTGDVRFATSETGTLLYMPGPPGTASTERAIALADRAGVLTRLPVAPGPYTHVRGSHDGARLAVGSDDGKQAIIWIHELAATSAMRRLTLVGQNRFPIWSPDGQRVAFQSDREGDLAIFGQRADGTGPIERLTKPMPDEAHVPESWSPDGKHISFSVAKASAFSLWMLSVENKRANPFGDVQSAEPIGSVFSPDGGWVAYSSSPSVGASALEANRGVFIQPFPPTGDRYQVPKLERDFQPVWAPKGTELFYVPTTASGRLAVVSVTTKPAVTFGSPVLLPARVTGNRLSIETRAYDMLPDGRFVGLVSASEPESSGPAATSQIRVVLNWSEELKQRVPAK